MHLDDWGERSPRWAGVRSDTIEVAGRPIPVLRADGPGADGPRADGPDADGWPQLLVHGLGGSSADWLEVIAPLAKRGPVVAPDLPGFGQSAPPVPGGSRVAANVAFLDALLRTLGWDRVVVHGNSMGGQLAVLLAGRTRKRVERLILASPALPARLGDLRQFDPRTLLRFAPFLVPPLGRRALRRAQEKMTPQQMVEDMARFVHADPTRISPQMRTLAFEQAEAARTLPWRLGALTDAAESVVVGMLRGGGLYRAIDAIEAPTLVLWGDKDRLVSRPVIDELHRRRPDFTVTTLPDVGHVPMIEDPDGYLAAVDQWLPPSTSRNRSPRVPWTRTTSPASSSDDSSARALSAGADASAR